MKNVLILSSTPRVNGNSEILCRSFMKGAKDAGHFVEKIALRDCKINYCRGCSVCSYQKKPCPQNDDAAWIIEKMLQADVIAFATPVYFYAMSAQMKTLLDRCCGLYTEMKNKDFYLLATAAEDDPEIMNRIAESFQGFFDCLENPTVKGHLFCGDVWHAGEIAGRPELKTAYDAGISI